MAGNLELSHSPPFRAPVYGSAPIESSGQGATLLSVLAKQWPTAAAVAALTAVILAAGVWWTIEPLYKVSANIQVSPIERPILFNDAETDISRQYNVYIATEAQAMVSPAILDAAINLPELKAIPWLANSTNPGGMLAGRIVVEQIRGTQLLNLSMVGENAEEMVTILDGVLKAYLASREEDQRQWDSRVMSSLLEEEAKLSKEHAAKKAEIRDMSSLRPGVSATGDGGVADIRYGELQRQLTQANTDIIVSKSRIGALDQGSALEAVLEGEGFDAYRNADPEWLGFVTEIRNQRVSSLSDTAAGRGPDHPEVAGREARVAKLREELKAREVVLRDAYSKVVRYRLENKIRDAEITAKALQVEIGNVLKERTDVVEQQTALKSKEDERQRLEQSLLQVKQKLWNVEVEEKRTSRVTLQSKPLAPTEPNLDRRPKYFGAALAISLVMGLAAALTRARMDRSVHEATEVSTRFGLPVLGSVQYLPSSNGQGFGKDERMLESMRFISTALVPPGRTHQTRVRLITSPTRGAGKSTVATHLARSLAASGRKVLLIDADNYGQGASRECGIVGTPGLREFLEGKLPLEKVIQRNHSENLAVIPSGERSERFGELLSRQATHERIRAAFAGFEEVIVDSAPVLASSSSVVLAALVDEIVLVIRAGRSTNEEVQAARQHLTLVGGKIIGAVLNAVDGRGSSYFYSYAYDVQAPRHAHV